MKRSKNEKRFIFKLIILLASLACSTFMGYAGLPLLGGTGLFDDVNSTAGTMVMTGFFPFVNITEAVLAIVFCPMENSDFKIKQKLGRHFDLSVFSGMMTAFNIVNFGIWITISVGLIKLLDDFG